MRKFLILLLLPFFVSCGLGGPTEGDVYAKEFIAAHDEPYRHELSHTECGYRYHYGYNMQSGKYEYYWGHDCWKEHDGYETLYRHIPDCYKVYFRNSDGKEGDDCADQLVYAELQLGSHYKEK